LYILRYKKEKKEKKKNKKEKKRKKKKEKEKRKKKKEKEKKHFFKLFWKKCVPMDVLSNRTNFLIVATNSYLGVSLTKYFSGFLNQMLAWISSIIKK